MFINISLNNEFEIGDFLSWEMTILLPLLYVDLISSRYSEALTSEFLEYNEENIMSLTVSILNHTTLHFL